MRKLTFLGAALGLVLGSTVLLAPPASAQANVTIANDQGTAQADLNHGTTLNLTGSGFQSIQGGFGGIYVLFGVREGDGWLYIPDSESKDNNGFMRFISFPGSETEGAAHATMGADGSWSYPLNVPGPTFEVTNRSGKVVTVDCRKQTCGVITIGAHGVKNPANETFTPVEFTDLYGGQAPPEEQGGGDGGGGGGGDADSGKADDGKKKDEGKKGKAKGLSLDLETAIVGRAMSFTADSFSPGEQVVATLDNGVSAAGPFTAGADGKMAGLIDLPSHLTPGTHELKVTGASSDRELKANFPIREDPELAAASNGRWPDWTPYAFVGVGGLLLLVAAGFTVWRIRRTLKATGGAAHAV